MTAHISFNKLHLIENVDVRANKLSRVERCRRRITTTLLNEQTKGLTKHSALPF